MQLQPGVWTAPLQTTESNIYAVVQGSGVSRVDGEAFAWSRGDVVAAPSWRPHQHKAESDAVLLRVSDEPVMRKLELLRVAGTA
jgi:gentisate 1,2-dioxygenase